MANIYFRFWKIFPISYCLKFHSFTSYLFTHSYRNKVSPSRFQSVNIDSNLLKPNPKPAISWVTDLAVIAVILNVSRIQYARVEHVIQYITLKWLSCNWFETYPYGQIPLHNTIVYSPWPCRRWCYMPSLQNHNFCNFTKYHQVTCTNQCQIIHVGCAFSGIPN